MSARMHASASIAFQKESRRSPWQQVGRTIHAAAVDPVLLGFAHCFFPAKSSRLPVLTLTQTRRNSTQFYAVLLQGFVFQRLHPRTLKLPPRNGYNRPTDRR